MKQFHTSLVAALLLATPLFFLLGCASQPVEQMQAAQAAMQQAQEQHADEFAASDWKNAHQAWDDAQSLIAKQKYGEAAPLLVRAKSRFDKARDIAKAKRAEARREIDGRRKSIDARYDSLKSTLAAEKLSPSARKNLNESCRGIDVGIDKLNAELEQGAYVQALNTATITMRQIFEAEKEVEKAASRR